MNLEDSICNLNDLYYAFNFPLSVICDGSYYFFSLMKRSKQRDHGGETPRFMFTFEFLASSIIVIQY